MNVCMTDRVYVPPETLVTSVGGESVILSLKNECYYGLDDVGTRMWTALGSTDSIQAACDQLLGEYEIGEERLRADLIHLILELVKHGLVEVRSA